MKIVKGIFNGEEVVGFSDGMICNVASMSTTWLAISVSSISNLEDMVTEGSSSSLKKIIGDAKEVNIRF